jgi:acetoin utilization deacetylase AcuC-like enzyme
VLGALEEGLARLRAWGRPNLLLYQAGADPYREDPYSPLDLGEEDLRARDRRVFEFARGEGVPLAWVLAGGYTADTARWSRCITIRFARRSTSTLRFLVQLRRPRPLDGAMR